MGIEQNLRNMKVRSVVNYLVLIVISTSSLRCQTLPGFYDTYQLALKNSRDHNQVLMIDFFTDWCKPCKKLDKEVYGSKAFYEYTKQLSCVKVDFESEEGGELGKKYNVGSFPTIVFVKPSGEEIERITGYFPKKRYLSEVARIIGGKNTVPEMEARFPEQTSYTDLFHLSFYYSRRNYNPQKRDVYFQAFKKLDPNLQKDSTVLLTNLLFQQSLMREDLKDLSKAKEFVLGNPKPVYQSELAIRIAEALVEEKKIEDAYLFFKSYMTLIDPKRNKRAREYMKALEKMRKK